MRKIISKIAGLSLGLSLAAVVGISLVSHKAGEVKAESVSWVAADFAGQGAADPGSLVTLTKDGITVSINKGYKKDSNAYVQAYANSGISFSTDSEDIKAITGFTITANGTSYNGSQSSGTMSISPTGGTLTRSADSPNIVYSGGTSTSVSLTHNKQIRISSISVTYSLKGSSVDPDPTPTSDKQFELIQSDAGLEDGASYLICNSSGTKVMAGQNNNNRASVDASPVDGIIAGTDTMEIFVLHEDGDNYTFEATNLNKGYLYAASSGSNYLRTQSSVDNNARWAITFSGTTPEIVAQGTNTRNTMQANGSLFACYGSASQSAVSLWKEKAGVDPSLKSMVIKQSGSAADGASYVYKSSGTYTFEAYEDSTKLTNVAWSVDNADVVSINSSTGALTTVAPGTATITAKAEGYNDATAAIEITKGTVSSVVVSGNMSKTSYYVGESWSNAGLTATANYSSGWHEDVTSSASWTYNPASPALNIENVTATSTFGGKSGSSSVQSVSVSRANPIQALYTKASGASVDVYGYYVGFLDGTGPVIMDGSYGIVIYNKTADVSGYTAGETILHVTGSISIYKGLYEIGSAAMSIASGSYVAPEEPVIYTTSGGETPEYANRLTTVTGTPSMPTGKTFPETAGSSDITINFQVGTNTISVFYKIAAQNADAEAFAAIKSAVANSEEITIKGFTGWYNAFQVQMNGYIPAADDYTAEEFSQDLLDQTDAVCALVSGKTYEQMKTALTSIWTDLASADKYPALPSGEKLKLAEADRKEAGTIVEQAMARYDQLTGKYELNNFINGRTPVAFAPTNVQYNTTNNNASTIIIVVVALTSITSIGVLLVIKRKRSLVK